MSEYQYYEWQTIDRLLTDAEQGEVNELSSHIDVTASQALVTYDWGDFKHDPRQVLARYFDAFLYLANWGTRILTFRFPAGLLDEEAVAAFCVDELIQLTTHGQHHLLEFRFDEDGGGDWVEGEGQLAGLIRLRNDILEGDYRCLYLAWLKSTLLQDPDDLAEIEEPPVPAGLRKLTPALQRLADFFDIDRHQIQSAAAASPSQAATVSDEALRQAIRRLTRDDCEAFLFRLVQGESGLNLALKHQLKTEMKTGRAPASVARRTADEVFQAAERLSAEETMRTNAQVEERRVAALLQFAKREPQVWKEVEGLLQGYQQYDQAVALLRQLRELAEFQKTHADFNQQLKQIRERYKSRASFIQRLDRAGLA